MRVTTDGHGLVSHAGVALLSELADRSGLTAGFVLASWAEKPLLVCPETPMLMRVAPAWPEAFALSRPKPYEPPSRVMSALGSLLPRRVNT